DLYHPISPRRSRGYDGPRVRRLLHEQLRFAIALASVAVGAALFAVMFRASLAFIYRWVFGAANVVDAITRLPWWLRVVVPVTGALVAGLIARARAAPTQ